MGGYAKIWDEIHAANKRAEAEELLAAQPEIDAVAELQAEESKKQFYAAWGQAIEETRPVAEAYVNVEAGVLTAKEQFEAQVEDLDGSLTRECYPGCGHTFCDEPKARQSALTLKVIDNVIDNIKRNQEPLPQPPATLSQWLDCAKGTKRASGMDIEAMTYNGVPLRLVMEVEGKEIQFEEIDGKQVPKKFIEAVNANIILTQFACNHPHWMETRDYIHNNFLSITFGCPDCGLIFKHDMMDTHKAKDYGSN